ncbi:unnamed protein product, partial [Closterium sp. NIES-54]
RAGSGNEAGVHRIAAGSRECACDWGLRGLPLKAPRLALLVQATLLHARLTALRSLHQLVHDRQPRRLLLSGSEPITVQGLLCLGAMAQIHNRNRHCTPLQSQHAAAICPPNS